MPAHEAATDSRDENGQLPGCTRAGPVRKGLLAALGLSVALALAPACGPKDSAGLDSLGSSEAALETARERAATPSNRQALDSLDLASLALARGEQDLAEEALRRAAALMTTFQADGEFRAAVGAEQAKDWKGEPYEKMAAFLTLGLLLHAEGDRGNALAMYKSAVLADTGTAEERYRSDFVPGWVLQALAYEAEGERENARQAMKRAVDAWWSRHTMEVLSAALVRTSVPSLDRERAEHAKVLLAEALSAGVTAEARDPRAAAEATIAFAPDLARVQRDRKRKERRAAFKALRGGELDAALEDLGAVAEAWMGEVGSIPPETGSAARALARELEALLEDPPNVVLVVEKGEGPRKMRLGQYGEILSIVPGREPREPRATLAGAPWRPVYLDSLSYQASTRGSRKVDGYLKGKAVYKDSSLISGYVLLRTAELAAWADNDDLALVTAIAGAALILTGALTNPRADIRQWGGVPEAWYLLTADLPPGTHTATLDGRTLTLEVPERGQLVQHITALPPHGSERVAPRDGT